MRKPIPVEMLEAVAAEMATVQGVQSARAWTKVAGKERVYVELTKHNGGKNWHGGKGGAFVLVAATNRMELDANGWAGAATRNWHSDNNTLALLRAAVNAIVPDADEEPASEG